MLRKNELLSIGEISAATGVGVKSLKYYEELDILKPAYIDSQTNYRYYELEQAYWIEIIQFAVEFGLPLKELKAFIDPEEKVNYSDLVVEMRKKVTEKIAELQAGLAFIDHLQSDMEEMEHFKERGIPYTLELQEKYFYVLPCEKEMTKVEERKLFSKMIQDLKNIPCEPMFWDCGYLQQHHPGKAVKRYAYVQLREEIPNGIVSPAGLYHCIQSEASQIEQVTEIFPELIGSKQPLLAIEMNIFGDKSSHQETRKELRVMRSDETYL